MERAGGSYGNCAEGMLRQETFAHVDEGLQKGLGYTRP